MRPALPIAAVRRAAERQHPRTEVDADDLVGTGVPERERVASAGALQVDRPAASTMEIADQLELGWQQVRATARMSSTASSNQPS